MKQIPRCARDDRYAFGVTDMRSGRWICVRGDGYALFRSAPDLSPSPMRRSPPGRSRCSGPEKLAAEAAPARARSEEHTSELQSLKRISYAVFCLKKKTTTTPVYSTSH